FLVLGACGPRTAADADSSSSSSADASGSTGAPQKCDAPGNCQLYSPCQQCGGLAAFDDHGCVRPSCGSDDDCAAGERCFIATDFDQCAASSITCEDDLATMTCSCEMTNDCNGSWCVPEHVYPELMPGPEGFVQVERVCGADDGLVTRL